MSVSPLCLLPGTLHLDTAGWSKAEPVSACTLPLSGMEEQKLLEGSVLTMKTTRGSIVPCIHGKLLLLTLPFA